MNPADLPDEDSDDLTDEEVAAAITSSGPKDIAAALAEVLQAGYEVQAHERRRRGVQSFWRIRLVHPSGPDKVKVFRVDWLNP